MNRLVLATIAIFLAGAVALYDLVSEWLLHAAGWLAWVVTLGLLAAAAALLLLAVATAFQDARTKAGQSRAAARGLTWSSLFAVGFSVVLFANCGSGVSSGSPTSPMSDGHLFWSLAAAFQAPLLVFLLLPGALAMVAATTRKPAVATAVIVASVIAPLVALLTVPFAFIFGVSDCEFGGVGGCAAGLGAMTNLFVVATVALFVPYAIVLARAINADRAG